MTGHSKYGPAAILAALLGSLAAGLSSGGGAPQALFSDGTSRSGVLWKNISGAPEKRYIIETTSGSCALFDYDGDGRLDIYLVGGNTREGAAGRTGPGNALFRNRGDGTFEDVTRRAGVGDTGWGQGCTAADIDGDGYLDLYVTNFGSNLLYRNRGDGTFEEVASRLGVDTAGWSTGAAVADFDGDGDLDLYVARYIDFDFANPKGDSSFCNYRGVAVACGPKGLRGQANVYYRNEGGRFSDATQQAGLREPQPFYSFQPLPFDADGDGDLDLFVANDSTPNYLYINRGQGIFDEEALLRGVAYNEDGRAQACMGADAADADNDGDLDLHVTNFSHDTNTLYENSGGGFFRDRSVEAGLGESTYLMLGFGTFFFDFDLDGWKDLFVANGHLYPEVDRHRLDTTYRQRNQLFRSLQGRSFAEVPQGGPGLSLEKCSRGAAAGDLDNDGDLDLVVVNMDDQVDILFNETARTGGWISLLLADPGRANRWAVGAQVQVISGALQQTDQVVCSDSYLGSSDMRLHFGLGAEKTAQVSVRWPDGGRETFGPLERNHSYRIVRGGKPQILF